MFIGNSDSVLGTVWIMETTTIRNNNGDEKSGIKHRDFSINIKTGSIMSDFFAKFAA